MVICQDEADESDAQTAKLHTKTPDRYKVVSAKKLKERMQKFADKYGLPFTLLSDAEHEVAEAYGVWAEKSMYGRKYWGNQRSTFVINGEGRISHVFPKVSPKTHDDVVLEALAA